MPTHVEKTSKESTSDNTSGLQSPGERGLTLTDNRPQAATQRQLKEITQNSPRTTQNVIQRLPHPLTEQDVNKLFQIQLGREVVTGRFESLGRTGMHNFIQVGGDEDGEQIRVHYTKIIGPADQAPKRKQPRKQLSPQRRQPTVLGFEGSIDMEKVESFVQEYNHVREVALKTKISGTRLGVHTDSSPILQEQLKKHEKSAAQKYLDLSYHETSEYRDLEFAQFAEVAGKVLNKHEIYAAYDILTSKQTSSVSKTTVTGQGPFPLTALTPELLLLYQDMHYKTKTKKKDDRQSTRTYEAEYTRRVTTKLPASQWRPFVLPESGSEPSLITAVGATLDVQNPTSGNTLGQGKITSAAFKHFQKSMELLNASLDKEHGEYTGGDENAFETRTKQHLDQFDSVVFTGMFANEEKNFKKQNAYKTFPELKEVIASLIDLVQASLQNVPDKLEEDFKMVVLLDNLKGTHAQIVKQFEIIGTIIALLIKTEKRQLLNAQMFATDKQVRPRAENIYRLMRVERELNKQMETSKYKFRQMLSENQTSKKVAKDANTLL